MERMQEEIVGTLAGMSSLIARIHISFEAGVLSQLQMQYILIRQGRVHLGLSVLRQKLSYDEQILEELGSNGDSLQIGEVTRRLEQSILDHRAELARNRDLLARLDRIPPDSHSRKFNALFATLNDIDDRVEELRELISDCEGGGGKVDAALSQELSWAARRLAQDALYSEFPDLDKAHMEALRLKKQVVALVDERLDLS